MFLLSLPARGAWIEMFFLEFCFFKGNVAPREGSVDRNRIRIHCYILQLQVAPREGSVDRNCLCKNCIVLLRGSLPARGAWIEIPKEK